MLFARSLSTSALPAAGVSTISAAKLTSPSACGHSDTSIARLPASDTTLLSASNRALINQNFLSLLLGRSIKLLQQRLFLPLVLPPPLL